MDPALIDTDTLSEVIKGRDPQVREKARQYLAAHGTKDVRKFQSSNVRWARTGIERFEELKGWQEARSLVQAVDRLAAKEAFSRDRPLKWQVEDAAVSAMRNIAEAHGRGLTD